MHDLHLTFIGSGNAFSPAGLCCNGFLVNERILFEAPPQALSSLNRVGADPNELDAVVISHHHGDHFLGLPFLLLHWRWKGRVKPIQIVGPTGTEELAKDIAEKVFPGVLNGVPYDLEWLEAKDGTELAIKGLELQARAVQHDEGLHLSLGYRCRANGRRFGYTGDTRLCEAVYDIARGQELLVSECASRDGFIPVHMNLVDDIPKVRAVMDPGAAMLLTHIAPDVDPADLPHTEVARDFASYTF